MKWYNSKLDQLPKDKQEILISIKGVNHVATFDAGQCCFLVAGKTRSKMYKVSEDQLYWTEYNKPGKK